jgi:hypothetical protein
VISWKTKLQPTIANSAQAAELIAASFASDEALWLRRIITEIGFVYGLKPKPLKDESTSYNEPAVFYPELSYEPHILFVNTPKLSTNELTMLDPNSCISTANKQAFISKYLLPSSSNVDKIMMQMTALPEDRQPTLLFNSELTHYLSALTSFFATETKTKSSLATTSLSDLLEINDSILLTESNVKKPIASSLYERKHTADGTLRRATNNIPLVESESYELPPVNLFGDNKGMTFLVKNPMTSSASRNLDVKWFRLREFIKERYLRVWHIFTHQNIADFFTKPLEKADFERMRHFLMNG